MANKEELKRYLTERLLDLDPSLSDSSGSLMYTKVIDPLLNRLGVDPISVDIETFILSRLSDEFPGLDVKSPGSVLKDVLVNPLILILSPLKQEIQFLRTQNSLADNASLTEVEMDALLANVLAERRFGDYARGVVRVYFNNPRSVGIDSSIVFSTATGEAFVAEEPFTYAPSDLTRSGNQYYLDIPVRSQEPTSTGNIGSGEVRFVNGLANVTRVANLSAFSGGVSKETNDEFLVRAERSLTERSLNTTRGIETAILNNFTDIVSVEIVGFGEPDMQRDVLQARVKDDGDESLGPLVYMTANWHTHALYTKPGIALPFTNTLVIKAPDQFSQDGGWDEDLRLKLLQARYIRVSDGSGLTWSHDDHGGVKTPPHGDSDNGANGNDPFRKNTYDDSLLHRIRAVDEVYYNVNSDHAIYIKLRDFDIYPQPANLTSKPGLAADVMTSSPDMGLNRRSAQGSAFKMIGEVDGSEVVLGAHLPFSDYVHTTFSETAVPPAVIPGRDFLYTWSDDSGYSVSQSGGFLGDSHTSKARMYPLSKFYSSGELGVGRVDSFLVSKRRSVYPGKEDYEFDPSLVFSLFREGLEIVDFGCPKYTETEKLEDRFGGTSTEEVGRNPGVMIQVMEDLPSYTPEEASWSDIFNNVNGKGHPRQVDLILHSSQARWADRGVLEGHYISCAVYSHNEDPQTALANFDGKLSSVDVGIRWQGWGRVVKVGAGSPWRLRVEGMDFGPLHENRFSEFSPTHSGEIVLDYVPQTPVLAQGFNYDPTIVALRYAGVTTKLGLKESWEATPVGPWPAISNTAGSGNYATKEFLVTGPLGGPPLNYPGMVVEIINPLYSAAAFTIDDSINTYADVPTALAGIANMINNSANLKDVDNDQSLNAQVNGNGDGLILTCTLVGEIGNQFSLVSWKQNNSTIGQEGPLENGVAPTLKNFTEYLAHPQSGQYQAAYALAGNPPRTEILTPLGDIDSEGEAKIRIFATNPSPTNIDYAISPVLPNDQFEHTLWNLAQELGGGFNYGFGPLKQIGVDTDVAFSFNVPTNVPDLAGGNVDTYGHEGLTPSPAVDGTTTKYFLTLAQSPIHRGKLRLHYWDPIDRDWNAPGQPDGKHYIFEDQGDSRLAQVHPVPNGAPGVATNLALAVEETSPGVFKEKGIIDYGQAKITLEFAAGYTPVAENTLANAGQHNLPLFSVGYDYYLYPFKAAWTAYRGSVETVSPEGDLGVSYDDLAFAPAYKRPGTEGTIPNAPVPLKVDGSVIARSGSDFQGDRFLANSGNNLSTAYRYSLVDGAQNTRKAYWIRLGKPFNQVHPSLGRTPSEACFSGEVADFSAHGPTVQPLGIWPSTNYSVANQLEYPKRRYATSSADLNKDGTAEDYFLTKSSLPLLLGATNIVEPGDSALTSFDQDEVSFINHKGSFGFLLPHPMGPAHYGLDYPYGSSAIPINHLLDHQVLQVYDAAASNTKDSGIVISGIPGGTPFPGWFGPDFEIESDKVHIGGMTDVYTKATSVEERTTAPLLLSPEVLDPDALPPVTPEDPAPNYEVLVSADDGTINATPAGDATHFDSPTLLAAIANHFGSLGIGLDNLVIEILNPPSPDLQPVFFRAIHTTSSGVKVDGTFTENASYQNVRFRALFGCTTSMNNPLRVLQQGNDLVVQKNNMTVFSPTGFDFLDSPDDVTIYLGIDSNESRGEYRVLAKNLNTLTLETATEEAGSALSYRVYTKQDTSVVLPLVRVKSVSLSGGDAEGINVPYKNPIDIVSSSFAGLNDDPINEESIGEDPNVNIGWEPTISIQPLGPNGENRACLIVHDNEDFVSEHNIIRYDVLRIETLEEPNKHFYVEDFKHFDTGSGLNNPNVADNMNCLVLDRTLSDTASDVVNIRFNLGRPAVGTAEVVFRDPTYFEVGPTTEFSYKNELTNPGVTIEGDSRTYKFRPSPLESAVMFKSDYSLSDLTIDGNAPGVIVSEETNFYKHGLKVGDRLTILTRVIKSGLFNGQDPFLEDENLALSGKTLVVSINGEKRTVVFSGPNPTTLEQAVTDINRQLGDVLKAEIWEDPNNAEHYYVRIFSNSPIQLLSDGTVGILNELRFTTLAQQDNNFYNAVIGNTELFDPYIIDNIEYVDKNSDPNGVAKWKLHISSVDGGTPTPVAPGTSEIVFVEARRFKHQRLFPTDMSLNELGLYSAQITLTSYDPNTASGLIAEQTQLSVTGHKSLGYEIIVKNDNYSYSLGEESSIRVTSVTLSDIQDSFEAPYPLAGAEVAITYDRSQAVSDVQSYLLNKAVRVVCNNPLARHFFPAYPIVGMNYGDSGLSQNDIKLLLSDFFKTLYPNKPLELYDVSALLANQGVGYVQFPKYVSFMVHDEKRVVRIVRDQDIVYLNKRFHIMEDTSGLIINKVR